MLKMSVPKGCPPQEGVLPPLLWDLVVNELPVKLNSTNPYSQEYADGIVILMSQCPNSCKWH